VADALVSAHSAEQNLVLAAGFPTAPGTFTPAGASEPSVFCGTFRLPFSVVKGNRELPARNVSGYYLADDFTTLIPIQKSELSLGMPTVRLELSFHGNCPRF